MHNLRTGIRESHMYVQHTRKANQQNYVTKNIAVDVMTDAAVRGCFNMISLRVRHLNYVLIWTLEQLFSCWCKCSECYVIRLNIIRKVYTDLCWKNNSKNQLKVSFRYSVA